LIAAGRHHPVPLLVGIRAPRAASIRENASAALTPVQIIVQAAIIEDRPMQARQRIRRALPSLSPVARLRAICVLSLHVTQARQYLPPAGRNVPTHGNGHLLCAR